MHLALPKKKLSIIPTYNTRPSQQSILRRKRIQIIVGFIFLIGIIFYIFKQAIGGSNGIGSGNPPVVIVTVFDYEMHNKNYIEGVKQNRISYANKHGK